MPVIQKHILPETYGLVVCGGMSSRMGRDKSMLIYHGKPQRYHLFDMLLPLCEKVFISCNEAQADTIEEGYAALTDHPSYQNIGPMAALLTAFTQYPKKNLLFIGCDYPFLNTDDLQHFAACCKGNDTVISFYNEQAAIYEPLLAWYPYNAFGVLKKMFETKQYSLQHFLKSCQAVKFSPKNKNSILSVDTHDAFTDAQNFLETS